MNVLKDTHTPDMPDHKPHKRPIEREIFKKNHCQASQRSKSFSHNDSILKIYIHCLSQTVHRVLHYLYVVKWLQVTGIWY